MERTEQHISPRRELLEGKLGEVLPADLGIDRQAFTDVIERYVDQFQEAYASLEDAVLHNQQAEAAIISSFNISKLWERANSDLGILDRVMPITASAVDVIGWDLSEDERLAYDPSADSPLSPAPLTWARYVQAMGKYMMGAYPEQNTLSRR